mgnify:CR=1 FL=1
MIWVLVIVGLMMGRFQVVRTLLGRGSPSWMDSWDRDPDDRPVPKLDATPGR